MNKLRIAVAAPWNMSSAIAQSASEVAFELKRRSHEVTILRTETGQWTETPARPAPGQISWLANSSTQEISESFDIVLAHFGDHFGYHGALLTRIPEVHVIGIFHDVAVPNLFRGWVTAEGKTRDGIDRAMRRLVRETYGHIIADNRFVWDDLALVAKKYPLIEWIARRTIGAIGHAKHSEDRLRQSCLGPIDIIPLAFTVQDLPLPPPAWDETLIAVVGHANPNKRIEQLIIGIGASYLLRSRCRIRVIGEASTLERERLTALAAAVGVRPPEFTGWLTDDDLRAKLRDVDVMYCVRHPVLEGASASLVLALSSGRPTLVNRQGCYAEVPDDSVLTCTPNNEPVDILRHLERLVRDPSLVACIGAKGKQFVAGRHSPRAYVDALEPFIARVVAACPMALAKQELVRTLAEFALNPNDPAVSRILIEAKSIDGSANATALSKVNIE